MEDVNHRVETLQRGMYNADTKTEQLQREKDVLQSQIEDLVAQASVGDRAGRLQPEPEPPTCPGTGRNPSFPLPTGVPADPLLGRHVAAAKSAV